MAKEDATGQAVEPSMEQLLDINRKQSEIISAQARTIEELRGTIVELNASLAWLKRKVFGKMSEKCKPVDNGDPKLPFDYGDLEQIEAEIEDARSRAAEQITVPKSRAANKTPRRNRVVMDNLPVVTVVIEPENVDLSRYVKIGEEHTRTLEMKPGYLYVKDTVRPTYALKNEMEAVDNGEKAVITAPMPLMPIYKGMPGASMLAEVLLQKYEYHVPFYRQVKQLEHLGVKLSKNTLDGWFKPVCELLKPLYLELRKKVLAADYFQVDETTLPVINHDRHKAVKEYIWIVRAAVPRLLFFHYDNGSRSQKVAVRLLKNFKGYLQTDGYERYELLDGKKGIILLSCWAHARRKFSDAIKNDKQRAETALEQIQLLYEVERQIKDQALSFEDAAELRARLAYPIMVRFEKRLVAEHAKVIKGSPIEKAILYTYKRFNKLSRYHLDGRYNIDNNGIENAARPVAVGRKNYLFCQNHDTAESTAIIYSFMGCCKAAGADFRKWMIYFLDHVHDYDEDYTKDIADLLPDNLKAAGLI